MTAPIRHIGVIGEVDSLVSQLAASPDAWNRYRERITMYGSPHTQIDDVWVRYNDFANFDGDMSRFNGPHESVWYPVVEQIPAVKDICAEVMALVDGDELGGVLITRVPPGGMVAPHIDRGWHACYYEKFAVQLMGNEDQAFCFEDAELRPVPGDVYTFDNSKLHWVINESNEDRITLIICIKRNRHEQPV